MHWAGRLLVAILAMMCSFVMVGQSPKRRRGSTIRPQIFRRRRAGLGLLLERHRVLALIAAVLSAAIPVNAAVIPVKPPGALVSVRFVAVDPNRAGVVYATTYDTASVIYPYPGASVYKSSDSGATWVDVGQGLLHTGTFAGISVDAQSVVYVNSTADGLHRSTDGGATWSPSLGLGGTNLMTDRSSGRIYVLGNSLSQSSDGGVTFTDIGVGLPIPRPEDPQGPGLSTLAIDPMNNAVLYVGMFESGLYKSTDGGSSWHALDMGLQPSAVVSIAVDPNNSSIVFAGTAEDGLFKSTDAGASWARVSTGQPNPQVFAVAIDKASAVYAGIYECCVLKSIDGGATWVDANPALHKTFIEILVADPSTPGVVYAGSIQ